MPSPYAGKSRSVRAGKNKHTTSIRLDPIIISLAARSCNQLTCQLLLQRESRVEKKKDNEMDWRPHRRVCAAERSRVGENVYWIKSSGFQWIFACCTFSFSDQYFPRFFSNETFFRRFPRYFLSFLSIRINFICLCASFLRRCSDFMQCTLSTVFSLHSQSRVPAIVPIYIFTRKSRGSTVSVMEIFSVYHLPIAQLSELSISKRN